MIDLGNLSLCVALMLGSSFNDHGVVRFHESVVISITGLFEFLIRITSICLASRGPICDLLHFLRRLLIHFDLFE